MQIIKAIREKTFLEKTKIHIEREWLKIHLKSDESLEKEMQVRTFRRMQKRYGKWLNEYAENINMQKPCGTTNVGEKVWMCWLQGEENAPDLVKACISSVKRNLPEMQLVIITEENMADYVELPEHIVEKRQKGLIGNAHFSDILRTELLCKYGGMWLDATVLCTGQGLPDYMKKTDLFVYQIVNLSRKEQPIVSSSWLIYAKKEEPILMAVRSMLYDYWEEHNKEENYFIWHILFTLACTTFRKEWKAVPVYNNQSPHVLQFELNEKYNEKRWEQIKIMSDFHKLNHHINYSAEGTFYEHIIKEYGENV